MKWYNEMRTNCPSIPCILVGNKIDSKIYLMVVDKKSVERKYELAEKIKCPFFLVSAADGTNVVRVNRSFIKIFSELIKYGLEYKKNPKKEYFDQIMDLLDDVNFLLIAGLFIRKINLL
jgi:Rab-like protein 2